MTGFSGSVFRWDVRVRGLVGNVCVLVRVEVSGLMVQTYLSFGRGNLSPSLRWGRDHPGTHGSEVRPEVFTSDVHGRTTCIGGLDGGPCVKRPRGVTFGRRPIGDT